MKVYFTASIKQRGGLEEEYKLITEAIENSGNELVTSFDVLNLDLSYVLNQTIEQIDNFYQVWLKTINKADIGVVEVSFPSTVHIGMEISTLINKAKPVICLYKKGRNPTFTGEHHSSRIIKVEYTRETIKEALEWGLEEAEQLVNRRFTFFINPEIENFLDRKSEETGLSKSEYIRELIEEKLQKKQQG